MAKRNKVKTKRKKGLSLIGAYVPDEHKKLLETIAYDQDRTVSSILRRLVAKHVKSLTKGTRNEKRS